MTPKQQAEKMVDQMQWSSLTNVTRSQAVECAQVAALQIIEALFFDDKNLPVIQYYKEVKKELEKLV